MFHSGRDCVASQPLVITYCAFSALKIAVRNAERWFSISGSHVFGLARMPRISARLPRMLRWLAYCICGANFIFLCFGGMVMYGYV